jgi:hypothetical protein
LKGKGLHTRWLIPSQHNRIEKVTELDDRTSLVGRKPNGLVWINTGSELAYAVPVRDFETASQLTQDVALPKNSIRVNPIPNTVNKNGEKSVGADKSVMKMTHDVYLRLR